MSSKAWAILWLLTVGGLIAIAPVAAAIAQTAPRWVPGWGGLVTDSRVRTAEFEGYNDEISQVQVRVWRDNNGCEYLIATGAASYAPSAYSSPGISITPRINAATKQPFCRR